MQDYISKIKVKKYNERIYFNINDIRIYIIDDINSIIDKLESININIKIKDLDYIDFYTFILLIAFSNDFRTYEYKFYLISSTIEKISEIIDPDLCSDRRMSIKYKKGFFNSYKLTNINNSNTSFKDILLEEINNSININNFKQII